MLKIAHIVNPVQVAPSSDLYIAQPVTFETMRIARKFSLPGIEVIQLTAQYPEDHAIIPEGFQRTADLERSILDIAAFKVPRKLPLIKDILDRLYQECEADYLVYTNADIALLPHFYRAAAAIIGQGCDAFIINRRTIPGIYRSSAEIPLMYAELGEAHKGWDCFVFKRALYPGFDLGTACIGTGWIGRVLIANMACLAKRFKIFEDLHLTFHIGDEKSWQAPQYGDYLAHNRSQCKKILDAFEKKLGRLERTEIPGRFYRLLERSKNR